MRRVIQYNNTNIINFLLDLGANINSQDQNGVTPLMRATFDDRLELVKLLVSRGAEVDKKAYDKKTALGYAKSKEVAAFLCDNGADAQYARPTESGWMTNLYSAISFNRKGVVEALLERKADINVGCADGDTPLRNFFILSFY